MNLQETIKRILREELLKESNIKIPQSEIDKAGVLLDLINSNIEKYKNNKTTLYDASIDFKNYFKIIDENGRITSSAYIPLLNATKISTGIFSNERIPELDASKITTGTLSYEVLPYFDASIITSGQITNDILPDDIDICGNITANKYFNLPIIGDSILVNSNLMVIINPYNSIDIIVTANILSSVQENIIVQIKSITNNNIEFILTNMPLNISYINYIIYKK
jgi:hypothetical protein